MNIMTFIPFEKLTIRTTFNPDEIRQKLSQVVEPPKLFINPFSSRRKPYHGKIDGYNFKIWRIIHYGNSFLPVIEGRIQGSTIEVTMRLNSFMRAFVIVWLGVSALTCILSLFEMVKNNKFDVPFSVLGVFIVGYLIIILSFKFESTKTKSFLYKLFKS